MTEQTNNLITIFIDFPFPAEFRCPECFGKPGIRLGGTYKSHCDLIKHAKKNHPGHSVVHRCGECGEHGKGAYPLKSVKTHHTAAHSSGSGRSGTRGACGSSTCTTVRSSPSATGNINCSVPSGAESILRLTGAGTATTTTATASTTTCTATTMTLTTCTTTTTTTTACGMRRSAAQRPRISGGAPPPSTGPAAAPTTRAAATASTMTTTTTTSTTTRRPSSSLRQSTLSFGSVASAKGTTTGTATRTDRTPPTTTATRARAVTRPSTTPPPPTATARVVPAAAAAPAASSRRSSTPPPPPAPVRNRLALKRTRATAATTKTTTTTPPPSTASARVASAAAAAPAASSRKSKTPPPPPAPVRQKLLSLRRTATRADPPRTSATPPPPPTSVGTRPAAAAAPTASSRKSKTPPPPPALAKPRIISVRAVNIAVKKLPSPHQTTSTTTTTKRDGGTRRSDGSVSGSTPPSGTRAAPAAKSRTGPGAAQRATPSPSTRKSTPEPPREKPASGAARRKRGSTVSPTAKAPTTSPRGPVTRSRGASVPLDLGDILKRTTALTTTRRKAAPKAGSKKSPRRTGSGRDRASPAPTTPPSVPTTRTFTSTIRTAASPSYAAVTAGATVVSAAPAGDQTEGGRRLRSFTRASSLPPECSTAARSSPPLATILRGASASPPSPPTIYGEQGSGRGCCVVSCMAPATLTTTTVTTTVSGGPIVTSRPLAGGVERGMKRTLSRTAVPSLPPIEEVTVTPGPTRTAAVAPLPAIEGREEEEGAEDDDSSPLPWSPAVSKRRRRRQRVLSSSPTSPSGFRSPIPETLQPPTRTPAHTPPARETRAPGAPRRPSAGAQRPPSPLPAPVTEGATRGATTTATTTTVTPRNRSSAASRRGARRGTATGSRGNTENVSDRAPADSARTNRLRDLRDMFNRLGGFASRFRSVGGNTPGSSHPGGCGTGTTNAPAGVGVVPTDLQTPRDPEHRRSVPAGQPRPRPRASLRREQVALAEERRLLIGLAGAVDSIQDLEEVATTIAAFFQRFGSRPAEVGENTRGRPTAAAGRERRVGGASASRPPGRPEPEAARSTDQVAEATRIQRLFRQNRRRAVQEVLMGAPAQCQVPKDQVHQHFLDMYSPASTPPASGPLGFPSEAPTAASDAALVRPFGVSEVDRRLRRMSNSAPGPDGLTYRDLRKADPGCAVLTAFFNLCQRLESVPASWKSSNTVMIHKKGDRGDLSNWRPLAMSDTTPKLFAAVLADRLVKWALHNERLSPQQKGFLPCEGCYEQNYVLQEVLNDARRGRRQVVVAWLDLSNAFGSVPHSTIYHAFAEARVPEPFRNILEGLYDGCTTRVRSSQGFTDPVPILSGVKQGCPLSPVAFNLALESVLRAASETSAGYTLQGRRYNILGYADDMALVADTPEGMETLLRTVEAAAKRIGLRFNPAKCATLHQDSRGTRRAVPTCFSLQGQGLKSLAAGVPYEHLGVPTGFQVKQTPLLTIEELVRDLRSVDRSLLAPWQKCEAVGTFILPRLDFMLRGAHVEKGPLKVADKLVKKLAKSWLNLPQRASAEVIYLPPSRGGCGLLPLADLADALVVGHAFRLLTAPDPAISGLARDSLRGAVARKIGRPPTEQDLADYLSGSLEGEFARTSSDFSTLWSRARNAARRLGDMLQLRWEWSAARQELGLRLRGSRGRTTVVTPVARTQVLHRLRAAVTEFYHHRLNSKPDQGKVFGVSSRTRVSNHFLRGGSFTRFADWRFVHRARLDVLPLNGARRWGEGDKRCRRCGGALETLPHVLCHCRPHSAAWQLRHDAVVSRISRACRLPGNLRVNQRVEGLTGDLEALRPDIVVRHEPSKSVVIIDVTVTFENGIEAFEAARLRKIQKYLPIAAVLEEQGYRVVTDAIVVGALGSWDQANEPVLKVLRISTKYASMMRRLIVSETIRWGRDIYVEHVSGVRQYAAAPAAVPAPELPLPLDSKSREYSPKLRAKFRFERRIAQVRECSCDHLEPRSDRGATGRRGGGPHLQRLHRAAGNTWTPLQDLEWVTDPSRPWRFFRLELKNFSKYRQASVQPSSGRSLHEELERVPRSTAR
ncbi:uncharacterized protein LOC143217550 [Lasioglossum baleicum]|uniref:uncharacterized protein LOC143217550 n=1 Tax=Lasioglossum baleicum TaxID=434251 RepID=UPI003FCDB90D